MRQDICFDLVQNTSSLTFLSPVISVSEFVFNDQNHYHRLTAHQAGHIWLLAPHGEECKEGIVLFNDALNTFYLRLYGVRHMVKDHSDSEKGNLLPPHRLLFPISSKGSFICIILQTG